ncbi:signal recognition particle-docking protein FtsY [Stappia sp. ES.058]|uniref:signal recognition particle-docking protein FtsY n=1 Tax=Stappia sp. ES.058 TaxID=1881061 RepID=UPI00087D9507|nr:signal recognition particle-docking protein FtsY [Stappia sp. ES.058]SDU39656.1 signal recognition particle-docking protein FtsY [Stappia sp. ES.058]
MSETKRGFFGRLFGSNPSEAVPEETTDDTERAPLSKPEAGTPASDEPAAQDAAAEPEVAKAELPAVPEENAPSRNTEAAPPPEPEAASPPAPDEKPKSWLSRLKAGLSRSSSSLTSGITALFTKRKLDAATLEDLEDLLIQADLGVDTAMAITERISDGRFDKEVSAEEVRRILAEEVAKVLEPVATPLTIDVAHAPHVILVVGVNGTGKTTTIGKLAAKLRAEGKSVMLAAGDTFRAAAVEQLKIWGERTGAPVVARDTGADAAGLVFDAMQEARTAACDVLLIDTAGRLQNRAELMAELEKVVRVIRKHDPSAPHSVLLTLDATTGQNALSQVEIFGRTAGVTGLVMTKLDGTARGGILVAIAAKHKLPVHFIGVGEGVDDLEAFRAQDFAAAIAGQEI